MSEIKVALRLKPFSHIPGTEVPVPGTPFAAKIFPTKIALYKEGAFVHDHTINLSGPVKDFTVMLDLEKGCVSVSGTAQVGYFRYILSKGQPLTLTLLKGSDDLVVPSSPDLKVNRDKPQPIKHDERLSLGCNKKQDWDLVTRRNDLKEILPFWLKLGLHFEEYTSPSSLTGTLSLLEKADLLAAFKTSFQGILSPRLVDELHQGIEYAPIESNAPSPFTVLGMGASVIRRLFLTSTADSLTVLPSILPKFHCGRYINIPTPFGTVDLEWTKKKLRRMALHPTIETTLKLHFPSSLKACRLNGEAFTCGESLVLERGTVYYFDRFEK